MGKMGDSDEVTDEGPVISPTRRGVRHQLFEPKVGREQGKKGCLSLIKSIGTVCTKCCGFRAGSISSQTATTYCPPRNQGRHLNS